MLWSAHEGEDPDQPREMSNDGCLPGRAGGTPDWVSDVGFGEEAVWTATPNVASDAGSIDLN